MVEMTEEQKRRMGGICCYNLLGIVATAGFCCALSSFAFCDFVDRDVALAGGTTVDEACAEAGYDEDDGLQPVCRSLLQTHGVGFGGFWITVPVDQKVCYPYTLLTPRGYVTPPLDIKFNSARALSITGIVFGGAAWFTLMMASCCRLDQAKLKGLTCYFTLATLFQGLSLLVFRSSVCKPDFFTAYFAATADAETPAWLAGVECSLGRGSKLAVAATVLWFVCNCMVPASVVPEPLWRDSGAAAAEDGGGDDAASTPAKDDEGADKDVA